MEPISEALETRATDSKLDDFFEAQTIRNNGQGNRSNFNDKQPKKRPRDNRVDANERLCLSVGKGIACPFIGTCKYSHDVFTYLASKPPDIGPTCYQFETFGFCQNGLMCRYGSSHIDNVIATNLLRPLEEGGVIERLNINSLSKELQLALRKRTYDYMKSKATNATIQETVSQMPRSSNLTWIDSDQATISEVAVEAAGDDKSELKSSNNQTKSVANSRPISSDRSSRFEYFRPYDTYVKLVDFSNTVYVAPLTTVGNLPFRRILKDFGADITCGEMAMASNLEAGQSSEWALLRRHHTESVFGVQIASHHTDQTTRVAKLLENETNTDFVDLNCGCPIDVVCSRGCGSALLQRPSKLCELVGNMTKVLNRSVTVKIRTGWSEKEPNAHKLLPMLQRHQVSRGKLAAVMIHGRSRMQRYTKAANWEYVLQAAKSQDPTLPLLPVIGNGDILNWEDWYEHRSMLRNSVDTDSEELGLCNCAMIGRGALMKPWLPKEIKENKSFDISAQERLDMLKRYCNYGLEHWGSDQQGVNTTRRFLLEWLSFLHRYAPCGVIETKQKMQDRPPAFVPRSDLEALMASSNSEDWIKISTMLLGPTPDGFRFEPKHKSGSYNNMESSNG